MYPMNETAFVYTKDMNDELVRRFNPKAYGFFKITEDSIAISGNLKKYYYPENIIVQHIPKKKKVEKKK